MAHPLIIFLIVFLGSTGLGLLLAYLTTGSIKMEKSGFLKIRNLVIVTIISLSVTTGLTYFKGSNDSQIAQNITEPSILESSTTNENTEGENFKLKRIQYDKGLASEEVELITENELASLIVSDQEFEQLDKNINEAAKIVGFNQNTIEVLTEIAQQKAIADRNRESDFKLLMADSEQALYASQDGVSTEQDLLILEQTKLKIAEMAAQKKQDDLIYADKLRNSLADHEAQALEAYEETIVDEKGKELSNRYALSMTKYLADLTPSQQREIENISASISTNRGLGKNHLGFSLQHHEKSSRQYGVNVSEHLVEATERLDSILTYEQKRRINFDANKLRDSFNNT